MATDVKRIQLSVDPQVLNEGDRYLKSMGLTRSTVFSLLYKAIIQDGKLPFTPKASKRDIELEKLGDALQGAIDDGMTKKSNMTNEEVKRMIMNDEEW